MNSQIRTTSYNLVPTIRIRRSPFWEGVVKAGMKECSVYNHMLFPSAFDSVIQDYRHLKTRVQIWDVGCQRQVEIAGKDANRLVQMVTPRYTGDMRFGECYYAPAVNDAGRMLNDPLLLKLSDDRYWFSVADSDLLLWIGGVAAGADLDVEVDEPDVSPLAVQGPLADCLMERVFGPSVRAIKFFQFKILEFNGNQHPVARSGYSKQGGFEIYVVGSVHAMPIWHALMEAGRNLGARAGCPNLIERIESGFLSYGSDITREHTPYESGLGRYCDAERAVGFLGREALLRELSAGLKRQIRALSIDGPPVPTCDRPWPVTSRGLAAGRVTSAAWSPDFQKNVSIGMIEAGYWSEGTRVDVKAPDGIRRATVHTRFFN